MQNETDYAKYTIAIAAAAAVYVAENLPPNVHVAIDFTLKAAAVALVFSAFFGFLWYSNLVVLQRHAETPRSPPPQDRRRRWGTLHMGTLAFGAIGASGAFVITNLLADPGPEPCVVTFMNGSLTAVCPGSGP